MSAGIIYKTFQGDLRIETQQYVVKPESRNKRPEFDVDRGEIHLGHFLLYNGAQFIDISFRFHSSPEIKTVRSPFVFLALDLPRPPLFQDSVEKNIIPQVALSTILAKYDGSTTQVRRFLPAFLGSTGPLSAQGL